MQEVLNPHGIQKSFWGKAHIIRKGNGIVELKSYNTIVGFIKDGEFYRTWDGYSVTTINHINAFLTEFNLPRMNKAKWSSLPITQLNGGSKMELRMNKENYGGYVLSDEERQTLRRDIIALLEEYDYEPTTEGVDAIINEWVCNKGWMINLFQQHPNYNGKFQIIFDSDYNRTCDKSILNSFADYLYYKAVFVKKEKKIGVFSCREIKETYSRIEDIAYGMERIQYNNHSVRVDGKTYAEILSEKKEWNEKYMVYANASSRNEIVIDGMDAYDVTSYDWFKNIRNFSSNLAYYTEHIATEDFAKIVNTYFPTVKAVAGQKTSRIVGKIARLSGMDKHPDWNREYAKYCDAINPLAIKRHTILSCHPIDYFTMSFGNSWASCHTIDKQNKRNMPNDYSGCYSSGTLSYMLDESSFVYYTVDKNYDGNELELQDKINRNMFHMGEDKLIQARVYPQATDGETGIYKQIREIAQKVISDCLGTPNMWKNIKGTSECRKVTYSYGTHYRDYTNFSDCNVSYLKTEGIEDINRETINIGHSPICPKCGQGHDYEEAIECECCYTKRPTCCNCGDSCSEDYMHYIDGEWYCEDCCFYCEYHGEWEVGDSDDYYYIENYGRICDYAYENSGDFYYCENCREYYYSNGDDIETEDGTHFCCYECATNYRYLPTDDGEWYPESEVHYCECCNKYIHESNWDDEYDCCNDCIPEAEEREAV